jgi:lysozyme family protein
MGWFRNLFKKKGGTVKTKNIPNYVEIVKSLKLDENRIIELKSLKNKFDITKERYQAVSNNCLDFPVDLMFALHFRESSLDFKGVLHNGERILGTGRKTKLVPAGRGPFLTWEEAAVDALMMKKSLFPSEWTLASKLEFSEKFNGLGYRNTNEFSPYVFAGTNFHDETGKYVADGKYSSTAPEKQLGVASILLICN